MNKLPKWVIPSKYPALYDLESATVIEMTAKLYGSMNALVDEYNAYVSSLNTSIDSFESELLNANECFKKLMTEFVNNFIQCVDTKIDKQNADIVGAIDEIVKTAESVTEKAIADGKVLKDETARNNIDDLNKELSVLENRMNTFTALSEGSTTADAELIDIRNGADGVTYTTAGEAVRTQFSNVKSDLSYRIENTDNFTRKNLVKSVSLGFINHGNIVYSDNNYFAHSNPIYLEAGEVVYSPCYYSDYGSNRSLWKTNIDGTPINACVENSNTENTDYNEYHIVESGFYSVNGKKEYACLVTNLTNLNAVIGCEFPEDLLTGETKSVLYNKSISFNGDSICYGAGYLGGYGKIIAETYNMTYENIGVSGATITAETYYEDNEENPRHWISRTISNMNENSDYVILEGGVNDASLRVPLGELSADYVYTIELDDTTFYGAMESMFKQALNRFVGKKLGFIITHKMTSSFSSYYEAIKACCEKWGIPYLDLNIMCPPLAYIDSLKTEFTHNGDGWHPNEEGYRKYYVPKIISWLETL